jgi:L-erythro-3,5-diaminohexanoate dehydrogenase
LPQAAWRLDNRPELYDNEILLDVETLNIDAASFTQMEQAAAGDAAGVAGLIADTVRQRGKMHNPVTGSGGMLVGTVLAVGPRHPDAGRLRPGERVATLVSLSLTPLLLEAILRVNPATDQVDVRGKAVLFSSGAYARLPEDMPAKLALAVLDVAGAPAQTARLVKPGDTVLIVGAGGKSGLLCAYEAQRRAGVTGKVIGLGRSEAGCARARETGFYHTVIRGDATRPLEAMRLVGEATEGKMADLTINCVDVPGTEMGSVLSTREGGTIYFFSMATSFAAAALGAEGVARDVRMIIGNGYAKGHALIALNCLRESPVLRRLFEAQFAG